MGMLFLRILTSELLLFLAVDITSERLGVGTMPDFRKTDCFEEWLEKLKNKRAVQRIRARILLAESGDFSDCKSVGDGVSEMRIHYGPGYRLYSAST